MTFKKFAGMHTSWLYEHVTETMDGADLGACGFALLVHCLQSFPWSSLGNSAKTVLFYNKLLFDKTQTGYIYQHRMTAGNVATVCIPTFFLDYAIHFPYLRHDRRNCHAQLQVVPLKEQVNVPTCIPYGYNSVFITIVN
jgi:hypothetical protein